MAAAYQNLLVEQGTTFTTTIAIDNAYGDIYDLSGYTVSGQIRKSYYSANATATFVTSINIVTGSITLNLSSDVTSTMKAGRFVYDTVIIDTNNGYAKTRILEGTVDVSPRVTQ